MDITNSKTLNTKNIDKNSNLNSSSKNVNKSVGVKFSDELKQAGNVKKAEKEQQKVTSIDKTKEQSKDEKVLKNEKQESTTNSINQQTSEIEINDELKPGNKIDNENKEITLNDIPVNTAKICQNENLDNAYTGLNNIVKELSRINQKEDITLTDVKHDVQNDVNINKEDEKFEEIDLIDNNMNIQEPQEKINMQMGSNMSFNSNGQQFAEFVNQDNTKNKLTSNVDDLNEEKAILSTMEENIAIANKNMAMAKQKSVKKPQNIEKPTPTKELLIEKEEPETKNDLSKTKTVENERGVFKVDNKTNLVADTIVSYDNIIMNKSDVEFFTKLVDEGFVDMKEVTNSSKSSQVSKTLADMLNKAMNDNKPIRIDFDNDISIIIKIDRAGKISADFLPSSQVAEAYLKENLPLLRQRFDDSNIEYNELNQRQRKQDTQDNKKKGRKDE